MKKINVLMVGVDMKSTGGMLTVAKNYIDDAKYNDFCNLYYIATAVRNNKYMKVLHFLATIPQIIWILSTKQIDIVHIHLAEKTSVLRKMLVAKISKKFNKKVVFHLHAGVFAQWYESLSTFKQGLIRNMFNDADCVCVLGEYWKEKLSPIVSERKIEVLYNGIKTFNENNYKLDSNDITFFAHLRKTKGIYELLEAYKRSLNYLPVDTVLHLCGMSDEFDIENYINENNLKTRVIYHGWVDGEKKKEIIQKTALYVLPTYFEGLSMTVLEGMSYGIPVITTNVTTMPELLGNITNLVRPKDIEELSKQLILLMNDEKLRLGISNNEFKYVKEKFSVSAMINRTLEIYSKVLGGRNE